MAHAGLIEEVVPQNLARMRISKLAHEITFRSPDYAQ
jgi:hypothetical protein